MYQNIFVAGLRPEPQARRSQVKRSQGHLAWVGAMEGNALAAVSAMEGNTLAAVRSALRRRKGGGESTLEGSEMNEKGYF